MFENANETIREMEECIDNPKACTDYKKLKVGIDLGTANIAIAVLNEENKPVAGALYAADVVRDGIVVEYLKSVQIVRMLKEKIEKQLGTELQFAATAIPPGIIDGNVKVIKNVVEAAGFIVNNVIDEPTAASLLLGTKDGAVVDIGGGTTGISVIENGEVVYSGDEATGGRHLTLVTAGALDMDYDEAEKFKVNEKNYNMVFPMVRPVIEKMASIILKHIAPYNVNELYLVGGTCCLKGVEDVIEKYTSIKTFKPYNPLLVTPIGIAMSVKEVN